MMKNSRSHVISNVLLVDIRGLHTPNALLSLNLVACHVIGTVRLLNLFVGDAMCRQKKRRVTNIVVKTGDRSLHNRYLCVDQSVKAKSGFTRDF